MCRLGVNTYMHTLLSTVMTTSKKKKSSTSLRVSRPYSLHARTVRLHRNDDNRPASSMTSVPIVSAGLVETPLSKHPESDNSESFSEYIETQADIQHNNPGEANTEGQDSEKPKQRKSTKLQIMEEWLSCRDSYLRELLRHDGRGEHDATSCADCGNSGDFSCSPALTVPTACITARNAWLIIIVSCPSIASAYVILSHQQSGISASEPLFSVGQVYFTKRPRCRSWVW
jgi:hypothetical protein